MSTTLDLTDQYLSAVPDSVWANRDLEVLYLDRNQIQTLPPQIGSLTKLRLFSAYSNRLIALPDALWALTSLHTLNLSANHLVHLSDDLAGWRSEITQHFPDAIFIAANGLAEHFLINGVWNF